MTCLAAVLPLRAAAAAATALSEALAVPPAPVPADDDGPGSARWRGQSLSKGAAGVAVLHGIRMQAGLGSAALVHTWLALATRENLSAGSGSGLWFGAPAVAFAVTTAAPGRYPGAVASLDDGVARLTQVRLQTAAARLAAGRRPMVSEFDLVRGLAGLGAYWLRRDPHGDLVRRVLAYLVQLTKPLAAGDEAGLSVPGWWSTHVASAQSAGACPGGYADLGVAHGIAGPLALLALALRRGVTVDGHAGAIERICRWLDTWQQQASAGPWWPEFITLAELRAGQPLRPGPARPSWCYGTPGLARAQQLAGLALHDDARQQAAEYALARCLSDSAQLARITGPALCHGWAGLVATAWSAAADAQSGRIRACLPALVSALLDQAMDVPPAQSPGLIEGHAGVALTLHSLTTGTSGDWHRCMLLS